MGGKKGEKFKLTVEEGIVVSAVYSKIRDKLPATEAEVMECTDLVCDKMRRVADGIRRDKVAAQVCIALSYMDLLESPCIDK